MVYCIEIDGVKNKADWLIKNAGAIEFPTSRLKDFKGDNDFIPMVVVDNGPFEAAGICYDSQERDYFLQMDSDGYQRPRRYLLVPRAKVIELCPRVEKHLKW